MEQLAAIAEHSTPVHVEGRTDIGAALAYYIILAKIFDDVRFGRSIIFPRSEAHTIPELRLSRLAAVVSPSNSDYPRFNVFVVSLFT